MHYCSGHSCFRPGDPFSSGGSISPLTTAGLTLGPFQHDPIPRNLNPREFLSSENISLQQRLFPSAVEVRVLISGFIVILFQSRSDIEKSWREDGKASEFGFLRLVYEVIEIQPTKDQIPSGKPIFPNPKDTNVSASLDLKIRLQKWPRSHYGPNPRVRKYTGTWSVSIPLGS